MESERLEPCFNVEGLDLGCFPVAPAGQNPFVQKQLGGVDRFPGLHPDAVFLFQIVLPEMFSQLTECCVPSACWAEVEVETQTPHFPPRGSLGKPYVLYDAD